MRVLPFVFVLVLATALGVLIHHDPGYAFFSYGDWSVELPLWLAILLIFVLIIAFLSLMWFMQILFSSFRVRSWWKQRQVKKAKINTHRGLMALVEGKLKQAEKFLMKSAKHSESPMLNYLSAAKAAEAAGATERRDRYLQMALSASNGSNMAIRLTQAQLQINHGELDESINTLKTLYEENPKNPEVLKLLAKLYDSLNDWQALFYLLPSLKKNQVFSYEALHQLEQKVYQGMLHKSADEGSDQLIKAFKDAPKSLQTDPNFVAFYVKELLARNLASEAEALLKGILKKNYHEDLVHLYGLATGQNIKKQLLFAESLLAAHPNDPVLFQTLGRLCLKNQLWGKAREYLEHSLTLKPSPETYADLGQLMERMGLLDKGNEYFRKGLFTAIV